MIRWLASRIAQAALTFAAATVIMFFLMRLAPGDPVAGVAEDRQLSPAEIARLRALYGLDQPLLRQFGTFSLGVLRGDLGTSILHARPVTTMVRERLPASLLLGGTVLLLNFTVGVWLGVQQAVRRGGRFDRWLSALSLAGYAMPSFWLGLLLIWLVSIRWHLLPPGGMRDPLLGSTDLPSEILDVLRHLLLPVFTLSAVSVAAAMRYQRTAMIEVLGLDYVRTARSKGLSERAVTWRHAWRNALFPMVTLLGLWLPLLVTGSVFVEAVFAWPGLGALAQQAIAGRDYPVLMGVAMLVSALVVAGGVLADLAYLALDPRVRRP
ncbi:MAG: ABC transporter permease [Gemmatimonadales bacterium]